MRIVEREDGERVAQKCQCRAILKTTKIFDDANIPSRFRFRTLDGYKPSNNPSFNIALMQARNFLSAYPIETNGKGLMFVGSIGTGKTHLAVALLKALITQRGAKGLFYDCTRLLDDLRNSYDRNTLYSERDVLARIYDADVLVLDELGAAKITDWAVDAIGRVINARYNDDRTTIVTSNYPNLPPAGGIRDNFKSIEETLGDRIGERMRSRLHEMCIIVEIDGPDFRKSAGRATFASDVAVALPSHELEPLVPIMGPERTDITDPIGSEVDRPVGRARLGSFAAPSQPRDNVDERE
jgi:DNA replication protein DnaC